jgi:PEP-CTERM motif
MQSKGRRIPLKAISLMGVLAMLMLWPIGSQAQRRGGPPTTTPPITTTPPTTTPPRVSVPEPSTSGLLLMGLGMTGLGSYYMKRRKREA